jgi:hypothetical protein
MDVVAEYLTSVIINHESEFVTGVICGSIRHNKDLPLKMQKDIQTILKSSF